MKIKEEIRSCLIAIAVLAMLSPIIAINLWLLPIAIPIIAWVLLRFIQRHTRFIGIIAITLSISVPLLCIMVFDVLYDVKALGTFIQPFALFVFMALLVASALLTAKAIRWNFTGIDEMKMEVCVKAMCDLLCLSIGVVALGYEIFSSHKYSFSGHNINGNNILKVFFGWSLAQLQAAKMSAEYNNVGK